MKIKKQFLAPVAVICAVSFPRIIVGNPTDPPVLAEVENQTVKESHKLEFTLQGTHPEGLALTYSSQNLPGGATLNSETGAFTWTPASGQAGQHKLGFLVTDANGLSHAREVSVTVT